MMKTNQFSSNILSYYVIIPLEEILLLMDFIVLLMYTEKIYSE